MKINKMIMDAKECLEKHDSNMNDGRVRLSRPQVIAIMEEYHQAKSKEEAEERYELAVEYRETSIANRADPAHWTKKIVRLAAFGKEES